MNLNEPHIIKMNKVDNSLPDLKWNKSKGYLSWGKKNDAPFKLLDYYNSNGTSMHQNIINEKVKMIAGNGYTGNIPYTKLSFKKSLRQAALDYELFNGFAFEVVFSNDGTTITSFQHIPFHKLRLGYNEEDEDNPLFAIFSNEWSNRTSEDDMELIELWNGERKGKKLMYYVEYNPQADFYPIPYYQNALPEIELGYKIGTYHLNQINNGFSIDKVFNYATGIPSQEDQEAFVNKFSKKFKGENPESTVIVNFSDGQDQALTVDTIQDSQSDKRFNVLKERVDNEVVIAHQAKPAMFIAQPGKLAGSEDRKELRQEFQWVYINQRQENMEDVINEIFNTTDFKLKKYNEAI